MMEYEETNLPEKNRQLKSHLDDAVDLLDDIKDKLGMFQTQRYYRLKKEIEVMEMKAQQAAVRG